MQGAHGQRHRRQRPRQPPEPAPPGAAARACAARGAGVPDGLSAEGRAGGARRRAAARDKVCPAEAEGRACRHADGTAVVPCHITRMPSPSRADTSCPQQQGPTSALRSCRGPSLVVSPCLSQVTVRGIMSCHRLEVLRPLRDTELQGVGLMPCHEMPCCLHAVQSASLMCA